MSCPECEYNKKRAQLWRHEAYKLAGHPLDWEPELAVRREWQSLTEEEITEIHRTCKYDASPWPLSRAIEAKLKEKNSGSNP